MATWPATLPRPLQDGYSLKPVDQTIRSDMEVGPARVRRISTARNDTISLAWIMTDAQFLIFRDWFEDGESGIAGGAGWFIGLPLAIGVGLDDTLNCRFHGSYESSLMPGGLLWAVSGKIEVR